MKEKAALGLTSLTRRRVLRGLAWTPAAFGLGAFAACENGDDPADLDASAGGADASASDAGAAAAASWASGGTKAMTMTASYPDPFAAAAAACVLAVRATEGPCTEAADQARQDISEGYTGLPVRLALRAVDGACTPLAGAKVKVWHTQITGSYSGNTPNNNMCLKDQSDSSKHYFRGAQTTDADGRVNFDTCFPGWYRGRAVHIHFTVSLNGKSFTSQLVFDQALVNEIFTTHPEYKIYGLPDTQNATDNVVGGGSLATYTLATARMADGAMLASKQLVVSLA